MMKQPVLPAFTSAESINFNSISGKLVLLTNSRTHMHDLDIL